MPLYEYQCGKCGRFERIQKFSDATLTECPTCGQPVQKLISAPAIQFKGTGWYVTDYARKSSGGGDGAASAPKDGSGGKDGAKDSGAAKDSGSVKSAPAAADGGSKGGASGGGAAK